MNMSSSDGDSSNPPPSEAMMKLLAPDGYYHYLGIPKSTTAATDAPAVSDEDMIKKNYRKLSLKHHPDRSGGDTETFRMLNRAQKVLTNPKLRQQYDILGLDLDDDEDQLHASMASGSEKGGEDEQTTSQGIVHEIASMTLTSVLQMGVRTRKFQILVFAVSIIFAFDSSYLILCLLSIYYRFSSSC